MSSFKVTILIIFGIFAAIAVAIFAGFGGILTGVAPKPVVIWGTAEERVMDVLLEELQSTLEDFALVLYVEKDERSFEQEFVNALAAGGGPDLLLLPQDFILQQQNKLNIIPYENFGERAFKNTFIEEGELFLLPGGVLGLPFSIDPLVMYWNRNIFSTNGIAKPPLFWDELFTINPILTQKDQASNIVRSGVALGEFTNVDHAKEIISALILQAGNPIVFREENGRLQSVLDKDGVFAPSPAEAALRFYTEFSNPVKSVYSWNRSLPGSRQAFLAGDLALYFGFAGELDGLRRANPNLNFDVAPLPQSRGIATQSTFGKMSALAFSRNSRSPGTAFRVAVVLTGNASLARFSELSTLPPVRRDLLSRLPTDAFQVVFYKSALMARAWLDPGRDETNRIFQNMVEGVTSGRFRLSQAVNTASAELSRALNARR